MAPTGRGRRRVGLTRMDAALDAMLPYGFPKGLVRKIVNELLKVYGKEGWVFIEEGAYSLLIETILGKQETSGEQKTVLQDEVSGRDDAVPSSDAGPSNGASRSLQDEIGGGEDAIPSTAGPSDGETKGMDMEIVDTMEQTIESGMDNFPHAEGEGTDPERIVFDLNSSPDPEISPSILQPSTDHEDTSLDLDVGSKQTDIVSVRNDVSSSSGIHAATDLLVENPCDKTVDSTPKGVINARALRRFPCHGWIGGDDDDSDNDFVELVPATPEQLKALINGTSTQKRERKRQWDLRPEDC